MPTRFPFAKPPKTRVTRRTLRQPLRPLRLNPLLPPPERGTPGEAKRRLRHRLFKGPARNDWPFQRLPDAGHKLTTKCAFFAAAPICTQLSLPITGFSLRSFPYDDFARWRVEFAMQIMLCAFTHRAQAFDVARAPCPPLPFGMTSAFLTSRRKSRRRPCVYKSQDPHATLTSSRGADPGSAGGIRFDGRAGRAPGKDHAAHDAAATEFSAADGSTAHGSTAVDCSAYVNCSAVCSATVCSAAHGSTAYCSAAVDCAAYVNCATVDCAA